MNEKVQRYKHRRENWICIIDKKLNDGRVWVLLVGGGSRCVGTRDLIPYYEDNKEQKKQIIEKRTDLRFLNG